MAEEPSEMDRVIEQSAIVADDAFRILRLNVVIIGIYASAIAALVQVVGPTVEERLLLSPYTVLGLCLWLLSLLFAIFTYEPSRKISVAHLYDEPQDIVSSFHTELQSFKLRASLIFSVVGAVSLGVGVWDGFVPAPISPLVVYNILFAFLLFAVMIILATQASFRAYRTLLSIRKWFNDLW